MARIEITNMDIIVARRARDEARNLSDFMDEMMGPGAPYVTDENGQWMTREQVIEHTRLGWTDEMVKKGWDAEKVEALSMMIGR